ncbi:hypothetical protein GQ607_003433 [Colletotrichum asianum]|uniref:Uncharacterized protein n=1 Tax=Colletotrichum asianum TaxID=702518 RepID=A0A8H3ZR71_9PEZI|nr:hypothetical protein GQ607_003433 [Colletotrichum asianum]
MQPFTFVLTAVFAATKCLQKNEGTTALINGAASVYLQADSNCRVTVSNTGYNTAPIGFDAYYDGPC